MISPGQFYSSRISELEQALTQLRKRKQVIAWIRFLLLAGTVAGAWQTSSFSTPLTIIITITGLLAFLYAVKKDSATSAAIRNINRLILLCKTELQVIAHQYTHLPDGKEFLPASHTFAADLDLFGKASLYQYINRSETEQGHQFMADRLLYPSAGIQEILLNQQAIQELAAQTAWRQQLQSHLLSEKITLSTGEKISKWISVPGRFRRKPLWQLLRFCLPAASFSFLILHIANQLNAQTFYLLISIMLVASMLISKLVMPAWIELTKIAPQLSSLAGSALHIQQSQFQSPKLKELAGIFQTGKQPVPAAIKKLGRILDMLDVRLNPLVFLPLNTFLFWDLQQIFALEKWKDQQQGETGKWFSAIAELETLSSFATLAFNRPGWAYPAFSAEPGVFEARSFGHPLIDPAKSVLNDFATGQTGLINIVTGSNMAGKSTFLRSAGCNLVLSLTGAPVCAAYMLVSPMQVMSSMRIADNLEESTSTFYAELKKLKEIIEAVKERRPVFLLLDEILRGTNSADRHTGSKALIKQLLQNNATGIVATHDIELAKLAVEYPDGIRNYHFDVQVTGEELYFDYKLKPGICQSMNASLLMKKIGIDL